MRLREFFFIALSAVACRPGAVDGVEIPDPDLGGLEPQVVEALARSREAVARDPSSAEAWGTLAAVYDAHLLADVAERCYRHAHELAPDDFRWVYLLAVVREINGADAVELIELFGEAAALRPDYPTTWLRLGDALWRRGRIEDARAALLRAIELEPDAALAHRRLGQLRLGQGEAEAAKAELERAIALEPTDLAAHTALAQACLRLGQPELAREVLARAAGLEPVNVIDDPVHAEQVVARNVGSDHLFGRGVQLIGVGSYAEAVVPLETVVAQSPDDPSAQYWLGLAHRGSGAPEPAKEHLERALEIEPRMNAARLQLADLLAERGESAEAAEHYRIALRYAPGDPEIRARLAALNDRAQ